MTAGGLTVSVESPLIPPYHPVRATVRPALLFLWAGLLLPWTPSALGQGHFTDCADGSGNIHNSTLVVSEDSAPNIDGTPLAPGSEVAVFSAAHGLCAGVTTWNGNNTTITVWGNDDQTAQIEGMETGEPLDIRVWDVASGTEFSGAHVEVGWQTGPGLNDTGLYQEDALMIVTHLGLTTIDPPPVPVLVLPADGALVGPSPTLDWSPVVGARAFRFQVDDSPMFDSPRIDRDGIVLTASGVANLPVDVTWYWRVRASSESGEGAWSDVHSFTTVTLPDPPDLTWPLDGARGVSVPTTLFWTTVPDATFRLQVARNNNFTDPDVDRTDLASTSISGLEFEYETTYYWRLRSVGATGSGSWSTARTFKTEAEPPPSAPSLLDPFDGAENVDLRPVLAWSESARATGYRIQISEEIEFLETIHDGVVQTTEYPVSDGLLTSGARYWWRVRAVSDAGEGEWSAAFSFIVATSTDRMDVHGESHPLEDPYLVVYPNPVTTTASLEFTLGKQAHIDLRVFDLLGREIETLVSGPLPSGVHSVDWQAPDAATGIYVARLRMPSSSVVRTLMLVR